MQTVVAPRAHADLVAHAVGARGVCEAVDLGLLHGSGKKRKRKEGMSVVSSLFVPAPSTDSFALASGTAAPPVHAPQGAASSSSSSSTAGDDHGLWDAIFDANDADAALDDENAQDVCIHTEYTHSETERDKHALNVEDTHSTRHMRATASSS